MAAPKAKTHIQQLGFFDEDLNSSTHDDIMIWLQDNIDQVLNNMFYEPIGQWEIHNMIIAAKLELQERLPYIVDKAKWSKNKETDEALIKTLQEWDGKEILEQTIERPPVLHHAINWEMIVERVGRRVGDKYTLGFIDMRVGYSLTRYMIKGIPSTVNQRDIECFSIPYLHSYLYDNEVFFEVKTKIPSVGALLRQINFYRSYKPGNYVVVCPDDRHKELLARQRVGFVKAFSNK